MSGLFERLGLSRISAASGEVWRAGDLGECISDRFAPPTPAEPHIGEIIRVTEVRRGFGLVFLAIAGKPQYDCWDSRAFRKIVVTHDPADAEFAALIKRTVCHPVEAHHG